METTVMGAPQQVVMGGGEDMFKGCSRVFVQQEVAAIEILGIEAKQQYRISHPGADGREEGPEVFLHITETSDDIERLCCSHRRALVLHVHQGKDGPVVMRMQKPFHCGGPCPMMRPFFHVTGPKEEVLGRVEDPFRCCVIDHRILDRTGSEILETVGCCCQVGMLCPRCADVDFAVRQGDDKKAAEIKRLSLHLKECCLRANRLLVDFGSITDPEQKKLLFASAMLLELVRFETRK